MQSLSLVSLPVNTDQIKYNSDSRKTQLGRLEAPLNSLSLLSLYKGSCHGIDGDQQEGGNDSGPFLQLPGVVSSVSDPGQQGRPGEVARHSQ